MDEKVIGLLKNISELIVATLVEETDTTLVVKHPAFLGIGGQNGQININFIPVEMLSLNPVFSIKNILADPSEVLLYSFDKNSLLQYNLQLAKNVIDNYVSLTSKPQPVPASKQADDVIKLF